MADFTEFQKTLFGPGLEETRQAVTSNRFKQDLLTYGQEGAQTAHMFKVFTGEYDRDPMVKQAEAMESIKRAVEADITSSGDIDTLADPERYALKVAQKAHALGNTDLAYKASVQRRLLENDRLLRESQLLAAQNRKKDIEDKYKWTVPAPKDITLHIQGDPMFEGLDDVGIKAIAEQININMKGIRDRHRGKATDTTSEEAYREAVNMLPKQGFKSAKKVPGMLWGTNTEGAEWKPGAVGSSGIRSIKQIK